MRSRIPYNVLQDKEFYNFARNVTGGLGLRRWFARPQANW